ncbi:MAG: transketolase [Alphaproteobacteria bacterium]|jgi:transketolase|nr:transketolase [Rhodospirillaceae bacterium]MBT6511822.1 transketolase [Rhodospirillaceae bacterium]MBT7645951.1 transketolase [Rhodospirillaceae bacterium]MDG2483176.1 transketolase [Alphaproteobacteria bacterium]
MNERQTHGRNVSREFLEDRAKFIRLETVRLTKIAGAGHYSSTFSAAELLAALYYAQMRINPAEPDWSERDRFVLSKGHIAIGLYPVLADLGFYDADLLEDYTRLGSAFGDHPDMKKITGVDFSSGSLGHGLSVSLGMALSARMQGNDSRIYCMMGDGELNEGQVWEAAMSAGHFGCQNLIAIVDRNKLCIDGSTEEIMSVEPLTDRFASFGWNVQRIDGHDLDAIMGAFDALPAGNKGKPQMIIADTVKGRGVQMMEMSLNWHVGNLVGADYDAVIEEIKGGLQPVTVTEVRP